MTFGKGSGSGHGGTGAEPSRRYWLGDDMSQKRLLTRAPEELQPILRKVVPLESKELRLLTGGLNGPLGEACAQRILIEQATTRAHLRAVLSAPAKKDLQLHQVKAAKALMDLEDADLPGRHLDLWWIAIEDTRLPEEVDLRRRAANLLLTEQTMCPSLTQHRVIDISMRFPDLLVPLTIAALRHNPPRSDVDLLLISDPFHQWREAWCHSQTYNITDHDQQDRAEVLASLRSQKDLPNPRPAISAEHIQAIMANWPLFIADLIAHLEQAQTAPGGRATLVTGEDFAVHRIK